MKLFQTNQQKLNDIIFANKNKNYGAYAIRSSYNKHLLKSLSIVISFVTILWLSVYIYSKTHKQTKPQSTNVQVELKYKIVEMDLKNAEDKKTVTAISKPSNQPNNQKTNPTSILIRDSISANDNLRKDSVMTGNSNNGVNTGSLISTDTGTGNGTTTSTNGTGSITSTPQVFVDENPEFEGGMEGLRKFIAQSIVYPDIARQAGIEGTVYVSFVIDQNGLVESVDVLKGVGGGCNEEAVRVIKKLPKFKKPGKNAGQPVKVLFNLPISFKLH